MRNIRLVDGKKVVQDEIGNICEIYAWENIDEYDVDCMVSKYAMACRFILTKGITNFRICTRNSSTDVCKDILSLYKTSYPEMKVSVSVKKYNPQQIKGYVILFNIESEVMFFNKDIMPMILSENFKDLSQIKNDFSGVDLMD